MAMLINTEYENSMYCTELCSASLCKAVKIIEYAKLAVDDMALIEEV